MKKPTMPRLLQRLAHIALAAPLLLTACIEDDEPVGSVNPIDAPACYFTYNDDINNSPFDDYTMLESGNLLMWPIESCDELNDPGSDWTGRCEVVGQHTSVTVVASCIYMTEEATYYAACGCE